MMIPLRAAEQGVVYVIPQTMVEATRRSHRSAYSVQIVSEYTVASKYLSQVERQADPSAECDRTGLTTSQLKGKENTETSSPSNLFLTLGKPSPGWPCQEP